MYSASSQIKPHQTTLIVAALVSLLLWVIPIFGFVLLPLQYLNAHLHEFCHAFMAMATGGDVEHILVFSNGSGVTPASGSLVLVAAAGYLGAIVIGGLMIWFSRGERGAAITLRVVGTILLFSLIFWVRGDIVGILSAIFWIVALYGLPSILKGSQLIFTAQLLGMQQCLASVQALYVLLRISAYGEVHSDAGNMERFTGIPAIFWALLWGVVGLGVLYVTLRASWVRRPSP